MKKQANKAVRNLTTAQIKVGTLKAYTKKDYDLNDKDVKATLEADIATRTARYEGGVKARKDGYVGVPFVQDAERTERDIRGKSGKSKKTEAQLLKSAIDGAGKLSTESQEALFAHLSTILGYE